MKMKTLFLLGSMFFLCGMTLTAQMDDEIGFKYVKAEYMLSTDRFDDAIGQLNQIIKENPTYKRALILRGQTKYKLAAYKGSRLDALKSIELQGITLGAAELLGKADYALDDWDSALNSLSTAVALGSQDAKVYEYRAEILLEEGKLLQGCEDLHMASDLGSTSAMSEAKKICGKRQPKEEPVQEEPVSVAKDLDDEEVNTEFEEVESEGETEPIENDDSSSENTESDETAKEKEPEPVKEDPLVPEEDDTENTIIIDEELTLTIKGQGLGKRKVLDQPSIVMLSTTSGVVAVKICVNESGRVESAEYDGGESSIARSSLVSLAIRKAKEFWFEKSKYPKSCGYIYFDFKAG